MGSVVEVLITVDRGAAIRAGSSRWGPQPVLIDLESLTQEQRGELARTSLKSGKLELTYLRGFAGSSETEYPRVSEATPETVLEVLDAAVKRRREVKAWDERERRESGDRWREKVMVWLSTERDSTGWIHAQRPTAPMSVARLQREILGDALYEQVIAEEERRERLAGSEAAEKSRQREMKEAQRQAEEKAADERRATQIEAWVEAAGDESQRARHARGMLPESEVRDSIRSAVYAPLDHLERFSRIVDADVEHDEDCCDYERDIEYSTLEPETMDAMTFARLTEIEEAMKRAGVEATCEYREHVAECESCPATVSRCGIMVRVTVGEFQFSREYAVSEME